jgi:PAS domain S-box-containing protein
VRNIVNASSFDRILRKVVIVPVAALLAGAALLLWQIIQANRTVALIEGCDTRIALTLRIEQLVVDQEAGLRGYEITHDPRLLQQYYVAQKALPAAFDRRASLVANNQRRDQVNSLRDAYETWQQTFASPLIATIDAGGETNDVNLNYDGKLRMDQIRARVAELNSFTESVRDKAVQQWHRQVRSTIVSLLVAAIAIGLIIGFYVRSLIQQVSTAFRQSHDVLRIRAEQTFRSEERLRTTLRSIADGVITCDRDGRVQSINDTAQELTGWSERDARDQPVELVFPIFDESTRQPLENPVARVTRSNQLVRLQNHTILIRRDGTEIYIEDSGSPIRDKHGELVGVVLVFRDVTVAKKSQEALVANEKLAVAGRLAATIAHEIHNPLDSVSNLLFLMDGVANDRERDQFLALAKQEIARVTQISRAMLSLYRESKAPVEIDLKELLDSILLLMESRFTAAGIAVAQTIPARLCIRGFPAELRQVFTNLITNASEAASPRGHITIAAESIPAGFDQLGIRREAGVLVTIDDDGPGIPPDILSHLFQPFYTTKGERGTGLGLWISRGIVTKHGGTIDLASSTGSDGHGTTATIFLPATPTLGTAVS